MVSSWNVKYSYARRWLRSVDGFGVSTAVLVEDHLFLIDDDGCLDFPEHTFVPK